MANMNMLNTEDSHMINLGDYLNQLENSSYIKSVDNKEDPIDELLVTFRKIMNIDNKELFNLLNNDILEELENE